VTALAALKADQARIWGSAAWQQIAERQLFPVHDELIARLDPRRGERWLDLAAGTGPSPCVPHTAVPRSRARTRRPS